MHTEVTAWFVDNDTSEGLHVTLSRVDHSTGIGYTMATTFSSGASSSIQEHTDDTIDWPTIDNQNYSYSLTGGYLGGGLDRQLRSVRITYTIDEPLP